MAAIALVLHARYDTHLLVTIHTSKGKARLFRHYKKITRSILQFREPGTFSCLL
jgi:hypothetical protein